MTTRTKRLPPRPSPDAYTALDLFSGAGGFSLGLEAAGFHSVGAIDVDPVVGETYVKNFGERPVCFFGQREGDMRKVSFRRVRDKLHLAGISELDLLVAAPPCQGFSRVGRAKLDSIADQTGAFFLDPRNHLYRQAVAMLKELRPRVFLFENVAGILHVRGRNVAELVCAAVQRAGYRTRAAVLNTAWYGVPQSRERVIVIGTRDDLDLEPAFPTRYHSVEVTRGHISEATMNPELWSTDEYFVPFDELPARKELEDAVTVRQAIADLPSFTEHLRAQRANTKYRPRREIMPAVDYRREPDNWYGDLMRAWPGLPPSERVTDHYCRWTPRDFETFARMRYGDRYCQALVIAQARYDDARRAYLAGHCARPSRRQFVPPYPNDVFDEKWRKLDPDEPCHTITAHLGKDTYSHIHYSGRQKRAITIREAARLQSFPDSFEFAGNMGDMFAQIGNAVPPLFARALGRRLRRMLTSADGRDSAWEGTTKQRKSASGA
jgi:DNA (cytosine-5)-methyltransferase 1